MDSNDIRLDENDEIAREILQQTQYWTVNDEDPGIVDNDNAYLRTLTQNSSLKLLQESKIREAFDDQGSLGLFRLFITNSFMNAIRNWTSKNLKSKGFKEVNEKKIRGAFTDMILSTQKALPKGMNKRSKFVGDILLLKLT